METWSQLDPSAAPDLETCEAYVDNPFWGELRTYLERAYDTAPVWEYSRCVPTGWNIKYRKGGRGLCTLYPMRGYFTALVVIGPVSYTHLTLPTILLV